MKAINVGDSGFSILRRQTDDTKSPADLNDDPPQWALYFKTTEQTHFFNCPFQLGTNSRDSKYSSEGAAREWSTVIDISIPLPPFKPVELSLSRSLLSKTPKQVFF